MVVFVTLGMSHPGGVAVCEYFEIDCQSSREIILIFSDINLWFIIEYILIQGSKQTGFIPPKNHF